MRSISIDSRRISASAAPKITALPAMLPRIGCPFSQHGQAIPSATIGGTVASSAIQNPLSSVTETARAKFTNSPIHQFTNLPIYQFANSPIYQLTNLLCRLAWIRLHRQRLRQALAVDRQLH